MRPTPALIAIVLLAMWLGAALLVAAVVAPAAFNVLPSRTLAGALVGRVLPVVFWAGVIVGIAAAALAHLTRSGRPGLVGGVVAVIACLVAQLLISPRIERIRSAIGGPIDSLAITDPRRMEFGRLHGLSVLAMGVAGVGLLLALLSFIRFVLSLSDSTTP
jgi:hypothetical protein